MIVCVDGTGPSDDAQYRREFRHSFVNRIYNRTTQTHRYYYRGPGDDYLDGGIGTFGGPHHVAPQVLFQRILTAFHQLNAELDTVEYPFGRSTRYDMSADEQARVDALRDQRKIFLTGYSRGGAIVIAAARLLQVQGLSVEAMFLFDAVNRSVGEGMVDTEVIPSNVRNCYHALRHIQRSGSRESFSHTGFRRAAGVAGPPNAYFFTTHGGLGGVPWGQQGVTRTTATTVSIPLFGRAVVIPSSPFIDEGGPDGLTNVTPQQELIGMQAVEQWMWRHLRAHRVVTG
jgi:hypothetical protein